MNRLLRSTVCTLAVATTLLTSCDKPAQPASSPAGQPPASPQAESKSPAAAAQPTASATAPTPATPAPDAAALQSTYGFVAKLPKDVDTFSSAYRLHDLWVAMSNSKFATTLLESSLVKTDVGLQKLIEGWQTDPNAQMGKQFGGALFGEEFLVVQPAGAMKKFKLWTDLMTEVQSIQIQMAIQAALAGKNPSNPNAMTDLLLLHAAELLPLAARLEIPPTLLVMKSGKAKAEIEQFLNQSLEGMLTQLPPFIESSKFRINDQYDFQSLSVTANKAVPPTQQAEMELQFKNMIGEEAKAKQYTQDILKKRLEIAWGWVDDYLVISLGSDHSHLTFASAPAESALSLPSVGGRAAQFADKKPLSLGYISKAAFEALDKPVQLSVYFDDFVGALDNILKPDAIASMKGDVKKIDGKVNELLRHEHQDLVNLGWYENGLHAEIFGGVKSRQLLSSQPLSFSNLLTPSTFILLNGRANSAETNKVPDLIENISGMVWGWYDRFGRSLVPPSEGQGAAGIEMIGVPLLKEFWKSSRLLGKALGDESAVVIDLNGSMEGLPQVPPAAVKSGRIPRIAYVSELKDRAALSAAWEGYNRLIKQLANFIPQTNGAAGIPEPVSKKNGDTEIYYIDLPMKLGDVLPHVGASQKRWLLSTSPSLTEDLVAKESAAPTNPQPLGVDWRINFSALWDFTGNWLKTLTANPDQFFTTPAQAEEFEKNRAALEFALKLATCVKGAEWKIFEEQNVARQSLHLQLEDLK